MLAPGLQYFGRCIHGKMDMNGDGLVDLAVGSLGAAVLLWSVNPRWEFIHSLYFIVMVGKICITLKKMTTSQSNIQKHHDI